MKAYRHGDLLLIKIEEIPEKAEKTKTNILLEGEVTGHCHALYQAEVNEIVNENEKKLYCLVEEIIAPLRHNDHKTIAVPGATKKESKQIYEVIRQREKDHLEGVRNVAD